MILEEWAIKHGVSDEALQDLKIIFGFINPSPAYQLTNENDVRNKTRLIAAGKGGHLWRNNVGATYTQGGQFIRYGLCNDSKAINDRFKSSDLIGIKPIKITEEHLGKIIGQFQAIEVKKPQWKFKGDAREIAQLNWIRLILTLGGDAKFTTTGDI